MPKVLALTQSPLLPTGTGRVARVLLDGLHRAGYEVVAIGVGHPDQAPKLPYHVSPANPMTTNWGQKCVAEAIDVEKPDFLFTIGDPWASMDIVPLRQMNNVKWVAYYTIDGEVCHSHWKDWLRNVDYPIASSSFGSDAIEHEPNEEVRVIQHGVDTITFRPMDKKLARRTCKIDECYTIGTVCQNQYRKNVPALMEAFSLFNKAVPKSQLYLHVPSVGDNLAWDLAALKRHYGLGLSTWISRPSRQYVTDQDLRVLYSSFDMLVLPSMGEGFGLPILEAAACRTPSLVTNYASAPEIAIGPNYLINVQTTVMGQSNIKQAIVDVNHLAMLMEVHYREWRDNGCKLPSHSEVQMMRTVERCQWHNITCEFVGVFDYLSEKAIKKARSNAPRFYSL